jgi:predicted Zn-dependent protease with MMP-like domain
MLQHITHPSSLAHARPIAYVAAMTEQGQSQSFAPSAQDIETLALAALSRLPEPFGRYLHNVVLFVEEFASEKVLRSLNVSDPFDLTGIYDGRPFGQEAQTGDMPPSIHLYRRPLLDEWVETGVSLEALIAHVVVHEVGHHFGLSDADMHALEDMVAE